MPRKSCSICENPAALQAINGMLNQKITLTKIASATGFSKSTIGRHSLACYPRLRGERIGAQTFGTRNRLLIAQNGVLSVWGGDRIPLEEIQPEDFVLLVTYEDPVAERALPAPENPNPPATEKQTPATTGTDSPAQ